jgi:hypothetical protein
VTVADVLGLVAFLLLLAGFVVALGLAVAPSAPPWLTGGLAAALAFEVVWLVLYARGRDTYFDPDHVTRWEFAARDGNHWMVVVAIVAATATAIGLVWGIVSRRRWIRHFASAATTISIVLLQLASFVLSVGH